MQCEGRLQKRPGEDARVPRLRIHDGVAGVEDALFVAAEGVDLKVEGSESDEGAGLGGHEDDPVLCIQVIEELLSGDAVEVTREESEHLVDSSGGKLLTGVELRVHRRAISG